MRNQHNINDLFSKASTQPVVSSFGETKELFLSTVGVVSVTVPKEKAQVFTLKKVFIMVAIISAVTTSLILLQSEPQQDNLEPKAPETVETVLVLDSNNQEVQTSEIKSVQAKTVKKKEITVPKFLKVLDAIMYPEPKKELRLMEPIFDLSLGNPSYKRPYDFPVLTEKQIAANNKRKKKMVKALSKLDKKSYVYIPSGSFDFHGTPVSVQAFHMQVTEVSNIQYKTFLFDLLIHGKKDDFLKAKPDQTMWVKLFGGGMQAMQDMYFSNVAYDDYPVVNVSREGAEMYCAWLTKQTNKYKKEKGEIYMNDLRIPVRPEWEMAASVIGKKMPFPWGGPLAQNAKGCFLANYDPSLEGLLMDSTQCEGCEDPSLSTADGGAFTVKTDSYHPNEFGLYNMSGNVAEMVYGSYTKTDNTIVKGPPGTAGGGWMSNFESIKVNGKDEHSGLITAHPNVGFRVVVSYLGSMK